MEVRSRATTCSAGPGPVGWTVEAEPWEAIRLLESRRTADEVRSLTVRGDGHAAAAVLDDHQRLPLTGLGEGAVEDLAEEQLRAVLARLGEEVLGAGIVDLGVDPPLVSRGLTESASARGVEW